MAIYTCQWLLSAYQEMIAFRILRSLLSFATEKTSWFDTSVQWCSLRPSVIGRDQDRFLVWDRLCIHNNSHTEVHVCPVSDQKIGLGLDLPRCGFGLGLAGLVLCCETWSYYARHQNDLERHSNFSSTIYNFVILYLKHHYYGDQQWRLI